MLAGIPPRQEADAGERERQADDARDAGQHEALGEQLTDDPRTAGAERRPDGDLALTAFGAREQQVGDVGAGDEQQECDRAEQQPDGAAHGADDFVGQREHDGVELHLHGIQAFVVIARAIAVQFVGRLPNRGAGLQPAPRHTDPWLPWSMLAGSICSGIHSSSVRDSENRWAAGSPAA